MPSVLIETGFLTNPTEEKFLNTPETQRQMSNAMFTAFKKYKNELEGVEGETETTNNFINNIETPKEIAGGEKDVVYFKVQIETSEKKISLTDPKFKGYTVSQYQQDGLYKYTVGSYENGLEDANSMKNKLRENGFQHAFVVAFLNGERINLQKAVKLAEK